MLCYVMLCYVMLCYVMLCYVMLCYVMPSLYVIDLYFMLHLLDPFNIIIALRVKLPFGALCCLLITPVIFTVHDTDFDILSPEKICNMRTMDYFSCLVYN